MHKYLVVYNQSEGSFNAIQSMFCFVKSCGVMVICIGKYSVIFFFQQNDRPVFTTVFGLIGQHFMSV